MTDKLKEFFRKASKDKEIIKKLDALKSEKDDKIVRETTIRLAKETGITLTEADFEVDKEEIDDSEMRSVAGGSWERCFCYVGGGGKADHDRGRDTCACVSYGGGCSERGMELCACYIAGSGD